MKRVEELTIHDIIQLYYDWQFEPERCEVFYFNLIAALKTADSKNRKRLNIVYPNFVYVNDLWEGSGDYGNNLFREHGIGRFADESVIDVDAEIN